MTPTISIGLLVFTLALVGAWLFNTLIRERNVVREAWAGIDVQLQKRHELIPNLVATVRGYTAHESGVLEELARIRSSSDTGVAQRGREETSLSQSIGEVFALAEDYPELKASDGFRQLHRSLVEVEEHLQYARRYYNGAVRDYNTRVESFPSNLVAGVFRFETAEFFEIELASDRQVPHVSLSE
jgi:LemA protein